jgi:multicomponent Na+:H+ antiporter subunit E
MKQLTCAILVLLIWMGLTWSVRWEDLLTGLVFSLLIALFVSKMYPEHLASALNPRRWLWVLIFVPYFIIYCVRANLDVAYRVLHRDTPIRPGFIKVHTSLKSEMARTMLANSITLTPGTLTVDIDGQDLYVHWINVSGEGVEERTKTIVRRFERILEEIFA